MRILITGSEGNIGSRLIPYLRECGHTIFRTDQIQGFAEDYQVANILSPIDLIEAFDYFEPEAVFHLAAMVSRVTCEQSPNITVETNLGGLSNVIQICKVHGSKLIYFSTSEVYGNIGGVLSEDRECKPNNFYGLTKYLGEKLVEYELTNGLKAVTVRPFMLYHDTEKIGDNHSAFVRFVTNLLRGDKITVHKGSKRSWFYLDDAVKVFEKLIYLTDYEVVNVGSDEIIGVDHLAQMICGRLGLQYSKVVDELPLPCRMTLEKIPDITKQKSLTGITSSVSIGEGIALMINNYENRGTHL